MNKSFFFDTKKMKKQINIKFYIDKYSSLSYNYTKSTERLFIYEIKKMDICLM